MKFNIKVKMKYDFNSIEIMNGEFGSYYTHHDNTADLNEEDRNLMFDEIIKTHGLLLLKPINATHNFHLINDFPIHPNRRFDYERFIIDGIERLRKHLAKQIADSIIVDIVEIDK